MSSEEDRSNDSSTDYDAESFDEESIEEVVYGDLKEDNNNNNDDLDNDEVEEDLSSVEVEESTNMEEEDDEEEYYVEESDDDEFEEALIKMKSMEKSTNNENNAKKNSTLSTREIFEKNLSKVLGTDNLIDCVNSKMMNSKKSKAAPTISTTKTNVQNNNQKMFNSLKKNISNTSTNANMTTNTDSAKQTTMKSLPTLKSCNMSGRRSNYEAPKKLQTVDAVHYNNDDVETVIGLQKLRSNKNEEGCHSQANGDNDLQMQINDNHQIKDIVRKARDSCRNQPDEKGDSKEFRWEDIMEEIDAMKKSDELNSENELKVEISSTRPSNFTSENNISLKLIKKSSSATLSKNKKDKPYRKSLHFSNERMREIDRHNLILYRKIVSQKPTYKNVTKPKKFDPIPPNSSRRLTTSAVNRKHQQRQIDIDNQLLKKRIETIASRKFQKQ